MEEKKQVMSIDFLWLALYAFAGFSLELLLGMVFENLTLSMNAILTAILWSSVTLFLIRYAKRQFNFDVFSSSQSIEMKQLIPICGIVIAVIVITWIGFGGFKPLVEFNGELEKSLSAFLFRILLLFG